MRTLKECRRIGGVSTRLLSIACFRHEGLFSWYRGTEKPRPYGALMADGFGCLRLCDTLDSVPKAS
jgi:hypothetical protein